MPVDSAVFLGTQVHAPLPLRAHADAAPPCADFVPGSHQYLLTVLSIWWSAGQLVASLVRFPPLSPAQ